MSVHYDATGSQSYVVNTDAIHNCFFNCSPTIRKFEIQIYMRDRLDCFHGTFTTVLNKCYRSSET